MSILTNSKSSMALSKGVYIKDDCGKLKKAKTQIIQDAPSKTHIMW